MWEYVRDCAHINISHLSHTAISYGSSHVIFRSTVNIKVDVRISKYVFKNISADVSKKRAKLLDLELTDSPINIRGIREGGSGAGGGAVLFVKKKHKKHVVLLFQPDNYMYIIYIGF